MPKFKRQAGAIPILLLFAALGLLIFLFISNTFDFKDKLFNKLFPKPPSHAQEVSPSVPDEILIKFKPGVDEKAKDNIRKHFGVKKDSEIAQIGVEIGKVPEKTKDKIIEALNKNPRVEYAQPNYIVSAQLIPNDTYFPHQWAPTNIAAPQGWDRSTGSPSAVIAVLDTGINVNHEDLAGKYIGSPTPDDNGHGTLVSGTAAAGSNNGKGVAGICWNCQILSIKVLNSTGSGSNSTVDAGITKAADQGAKVINLSLGSYSGPQDMQDAVNYAWNHGVIVVAASGNDNTTSAFYPAAYNNVVAVGGSSGNNEKLSISNYGPWLDVVAPGASILTTNMGGSYDFASGTSMASPHVAGLAGLILSANPGLTNQQVVDIITSTAIDLGVPSKDDYYGYGRIAVDRALQKATGITPNPDNRIPQATITSPANGASVSGLVDVKVDALDNVGVTKVDLLIQRDYGVTELFATDVSTPYDFLWDTTKVTKGSTATFTAIAYDAVGLKGTSSGVTVTVGNSTSDTAPPTVNITSPTSGTTVSGNVTVTASATDNVSVSSITLLVNGAFESQTTSSPYSFTWDTTKVPNSSYTLQVTALDPSNNLGQSTIITVNVNNSISSPSPTPTPSATSTPAPSPTPTPSSPPSDITPPTVSITNPTGTTVKAASKVNITATASDNTGISKVEFYVNGSNKCTISLNQTNYSCPWSVPGKKNTQYTITAKAYDLSNNTNSSSVTVKAQ